MKRNSVLVLILAFFFPFLSSALVAGPASDVVCNGCINTRDIADNAVTTYRIKDFSIQGRDLSRDSVGPGKVQDGAIAWAEAGRVIARPNQAVGSHCGRTAGYLGRQYGVEA